MYDAAMAEETRRVPMFLSGPTAALAVLLPMRLYVGWFWLKLGLDKLSAGWLGADQQAMTDELKDLPSYNFVADAFISAARDNVMVSQWLVTLGQIFFGAMMMAGGVTRVTGAALALMALLWWVCSGYPWAGWPIPMALMSVTLAIAAAGRYLGLDAILRARMVKVPLF